MEKHKTGKSAWPAGRYLKYAVGEIVLVVIGILIALQINNWNEDQKNKALEKYMLENLVENLEQNCDKLKSRIRSISYYQKSGAVIISAIENKLIDQDSLGQLLSYCFNEYIRYWTIRNRI